MNMCEKIIYLKELNVLKNESGKIDLTATMVPVQKVLLTVKQKANQQASSRSDRIMTFEYSESNRISGFTLSVSVPPAARPTYSFVLDWEKQKEPKISSSNDKKKKHNVKQFSCNTQIFDSQKYHLIDLCIAKINMVERTIKDSNSLSSTENSLSLSKLLAAKESEKIGGDWKSQTDRVRHFTHSEFEKKTDVEEKQHANAKNQPYDNLESYERSIDNDSKRNKDLNNMNRSEEYRNFMIELTVIIRNFKNDNETTENVITDKIISSSTLINALKSILRNAPISSMHV
uniref:C2 NT-type domain-containing protein n=1 Tax=Elaeophora elaphi TaxID=1147741 RepID=A0A0R3S6I6_9BILA